MCVCWLWLCLNYHVMTHFGDLSPGINSVSSIYSFEDDASWVRDWRACVDCFIIPWLLIFVVDYCRWQWLCWFDFWSWLSLFIMFSAEKFKISRYVIIRAIMLWLFSKFYIWKRYFGKERIVGVFQTRSHMTIFFVYINDKTNSYMWLAIPII